jgi:hypothetical protein
MTDAVAEKWLGSLLGRAKSSEPITGVEPTMPAETNWSKVPKVDPLIQRLAQAQRDLDRAERTAMEARQAAEAYREQVEMIKEEIEQALIYIGILDAELKP